MASGNDVLLALKNAIQSKSPITYKNNGGPASNLSSASHIVLSSALSFPKNTPTRLRNSGRTGAPSSTSHDPQANPSDFFTLEAVYLVWLLRDASAADYVRQAREHGLVTGFVSITERKSLVDWLEGRTSTHDKIVPLASK
jgi:parafibromin